MLSLATTLLVQARPPELAQLDELFALERQGQSVSKLLLSRYIEGDGGLRVFDWRAWQAAIRLCHAFYQAHEHFLRYIRSAKDDNWTKHEPMVLVQLFHHRKVEFLLRFLRYKKRNSGQWRELHAMFLLAHEADLASRPEAHGGSDTVNRVAGKLEQQYLQILLLEAMNGGQFSPREAFWAHRWFARWCNGSGLQLTRIDGCVHEKPEWFRGRPGRFGRAQTGTGHRGQASLFRFVAFVRDDRPGNGVVARRCCASAGCDHGGSRRATGAAEQTRGPLCARSPPTSNTAGSARRSI